MFKKIKKPKNEDPLIVAIMNGNLEYVKNVILKGSFTLSPSWLEGYSLLRVAIECHNNEIASWLISNGCRINRIDDTDTTNTPLHLAIYYDENNIAAELLEKGVCKNVKNSIGETPLHISISKKNIVITRLLLKDSSIASVPDNFLETPLHMAVANECLETIQLLLNHKIDINVCTLNPCYQGFTPLHIAIFNRNEKIVKILLQYGADIEAVIKSDEFQENKPLLKYELFTALHLAVELNDIDIVKLLVEHGANVNAVVESTGKTPLHTAIQSQNIKMFILLLEYKANFHAKTKCGKNVLHLAVENNWPTLAATIIQTGLNVDDQTDDGETPIFIASKLGYINLIKLLLNYRANINIRNSKNQTPLHAAAAAECDSKIVNILLDNGSIIDAVDYNNETPLSIAVKNNNIDITSEILKYNPCIKNKYSESALVHVIKNSNNSCYLNVINLMLQYGFELNINDIKNTDLLYNSVSQGYIETIKYLTEKLRIFQYDSKNLKNKFSLHKAVVNQNFDIVQLLINNGCDVNISDENGITPLGYAIEKNNLTILDYILKNGANIKHDAYPVLTAAKRNDILLIQILLKYGANVSISDEFGTTALHFATWNKNPRFVKFLLHNGACVNTTESFTAKILATNIQCEEHDSYTREFRRRVFTSPLHIAVSKKSTLLCVTLLEYHASVNCKDGYGHTPLHIASAIKSNEQKNMIEKLLSYGADINALDDFKRLPIYYIYNQFCMCSIAFQNQYELYSECECDLYDINDDYNINDVITVFIKHIAFLTAINKYIHEDNIKIISNDEFLRTLYDSCLLEITLMKETKVINFISFFDILSKKTSSVALYFCNEDIIEAFKTSNYESKFPLYCDWLQKQYNIAKARKRLLNLAVISFNKILKFKLPEVISAQIFEYLHLNDLNNLSMAGAYCINENNQKEKSDKRLKVFR